jgi:hypothetical protein
LFGLFLQERGVNYRLQGIADVVIHFRNYPHSGQNKLVLVPLIGKYHRTGSDANQKIINQRWHPPNAQLVQHGPEGHPENENAKAKEKAE